MNEQDFWAVIKHSLITQMPADHEATVKHSLMVQAEVTWPSVTEESSVPRDEFHD
jgi:hypothetical protein